MKAALHFTALHDSVRLMACLAAVCRSLHSRFKAILQQNSENYSAKGVFPVTAFMKTRGVWCMEMSSLFSPCRRRESNEETLTQRNIAQGKPPANIPPIRETSTCRHVFSKIPNTKTGRGGHEIHIPSPPPGNTTAQKHLLALIANCKYQSPRNSRLWKRKQTVTSCHFLPQGFIVR